MDFNVKWLWKCVIIVCIKMSLFSRVCEGVSCTWIRSDDSTGTYRAIGSPATFTATVDGTATDLSLVQWNYNSTVVALWRYRLTSGYSPISMTFDRGSASVELNGTITTLSISFTSMGLEDNQTALLATKNDCDINQSSGNFDLHVKYCGASSGSGSLTDVDLSSLSVTGYSYNEMVNVSCRETPTTEVTLTCLANATWLKDGSCPAVTTPEPDVTSTPEVTTFDTSAITSVHSTFPGEFPCDATIPAIVLLVFEAIFIVLMIFPLYSLGIDWIKENIKFFILAMTSIVVGLVCVIVDFLPSDQLCKPGELSNGQIAATCIGALAVVVIGAFDVYVWKAWKKEVPPTVTDGTGTGTEMDAPKRDNGYSKGSTDPTK